MLRRLFGLACACAVAPAWAQSCRDAECLRLTPQALAHARRHFADLAHAVSELPPAQRIGFVNAAVNRLVTLADDAELGAVDVWLTPLETLARGRGDCEDIAIAKFFLLLAGGVDAGGVRLLYARRCDPATHGHVTAHVVALARTPFADPLVLDNVNPIALPVSLRDDLEPVFSFDRTQLWSGVRGPCHGGAPQRLRPWRDVLGRVVTQQSSFHFREELVDAASIY